MKLDLTVTITAILGIAAIISPIATAIINNLYQIELKKLEYQQKEKENSFFYKRGIYEEYLKRTGECITYPDEDAARKYGEIYGLALIYFPENYIEDLKELNEIIRHSNTKEKIAFFNKLAPKIRTILRSM